MNPGESFTLGTLTVPFRAALGYTQQIEPLNARTIRRMASGAALVQTAWKGKHRVTLAGSGWAPVGVGELDFDAPMVLKCPMPEAVRGGGVAITLPATRRTDTGYTPFGRAHLADGTEVDTPVALAGDVATCTAVAGAVAYAVWYWPQFTVYATEPTTTGDASAADFAWQLICEEA